MGERDVTVIVPVKDRRERMLCCLEALLAQDHPSFEVIVVDNGSSDGTYEACLERAAGAGQPVRVERVGGGRSRARNAGAGLAQGTILAFTDSDCLPAPGWLTAGTRPFADPGVGVVTGMVLPEDPPPHDAWPATQELTEQTWRFEACNLFVRREAFAATAGFDEELEWGEDTVAGWRVLETGWEARFAPDALVHHDVTYPGFAWHLRRGLRYGTIAAIVRRHPELRGRALWHRYFLLRGNAALVAALAGLVLGRRLRPALVLALPYARLRWVGVHSRGALRMQGQIVVFDLVVLLGMVLGSVRSRRLVL